MLAGYLHTEVDSKLVSDVCIVLLICFQPNVGSAVFVFLHAGFIEF